MKIIHKILFYSSLSLLLFSIILYATGFTYYASVVLFFGLTTLTFGIQGHAFLKNFTFTTVVAAASILSLLYPNLFTTWGSFSLKQLIIPLLQIIMFGMGAAMSFKDFLGVIKMPKAVGIGVLCQFTIMPLVGLAIAYLFDFPAEIAAGVILVGSSPSGLASNVMSYLAKANLALSVTLTAFATLLAPIMTPFLMKILAGQYIDIDFWSMLINISKIVILPIIAGLIFNHFFYGKFKWLDKAMPVVSMAGITFIIAIIIAAGRDNLLAIGFGLLLAAVLHNTLGYFFGYWTCKLFKMPEKDCRTIALEVGLQNSGLASGIALTLGKVSTLGLVPAIFGPWMNVSGSCLASWWRHVSNKKNNSKEEV